jgi:hypothetical protein
MAFKKKFSIGDVVTCKEPVIAYGSGQACEPVCLFEPGMEGIVGALNTPNVTGSERTFTCVDFYRDGVPYNVVHTYGRDPWRCALYDDNIVVIQREELFMDAGEVRAYAESILAKWASSPGMGHTALHTLHLALDLFPTHESTLKILKKLYSLHGMAVNFGWTDIARDAMTFIRVIRRQEPNA